MLFRSQMLVLDNHVARRREINSLYRELLKNVAGLSFHTNPNKDFKSNYWLTCILIDSAITGFTREDVRLKMDSENIETRPLWKPMHLQPVFKDAPYYGDTTAEKLFEDGLCLPSGPGLTDEDIERVARVFLELVKG